MKPDASLRKQSGASLIEVLVAILLLSFGMLSLGALMSYAIQAPKLSAYRAVATNLAANYIERIRANVTGFDALGYDNANYFDGSTGSFTLPTSLCVYPNCTPATMATRDFNEMKVAIREDLPAGALLMQRDGGSTTVGNLWIIWQEPSTFAALDATNSDNCPAEVTNLALTPAPRCLYVRFKL